MSTIPIETQQVALIMDATSGLGLETAHGLARYRMRVLLIGCNDDAGSTAANSINKEMGEGQATFLHADLSVQSHLHNLAEKVRELTPRLCAASIQNC